MNAALCGLLRNSTLIAAFSAWILAQLIKFILGIIQDHEVDLTRLTSSGGMPSGHAALVSAVAYGVGREHGVVSSEFALAVVIGLIVMYDAAGVRQSVGIQSQIMNDMLHEFYREKSIAPLKIREILGHTPLEVIAGAFLGLFMAMLI